MGETKTILLSLLVLCGLNSEVYSQSKYAEDFVVVFDSIEKNEANAKIEEFKNPEYNYSFKKKQEKLFDKFCNEKADYFLELREENIAFIEKELSSYLEGILQNIVKANPSLPQDYFRVYLYRSNEPNAFSIDKGVLLFNIGMLENLQYEDEIGFILSHEIGHDLLEHYYKRVTNEITLMTNKDLNRRYKKSSKGKYYSSEDSPYSILRSVIATKMQLSQEHELQADSIALELMKNTNYNIGASVQVMEILDSADYFGAKDTIYIDKLLSNDVKYIKDHWEKEVAEKTFWDRNDSLYIIDEEMKTHPSAFVRIASLNYAIKEMGLNGNEIDKQIPKHLREKITF